MQQTQQINACPGYYITTSEPFKIYNRFGKEITQSKQDNGYLHVHLTVGGVPKYYYVYRLIAEQFIPNPHNYNEVDHRNRNRIDNRLSNLRWVTSSQNNKNKTSYNGVKRKYFNYGDFNYLGFIKVVYNGITYPKLYYDLYSDSFVEDTGDEYVELNVISESCVRSWLNNERKTIAIKKYKYQNNIWI